MSSKGYLVLYNSVQTLGWTLLLAQMLMHFAQGGSYSTVYGSVSCTLQIFQTAAVLEIFHAAFGLTRSNVQVTFQQVFSRVYVTWAILHLLPTTRVSIGVPMLLVAWTITEIIRYSMYAIQLVGSPPYALTWLRYSFFIIAYPLGVTGELVCSYAGYQEATARNVGVLALPNLLNATFYFPYIIAFIGLLYIPLFPGMYLHVFSQRRKVLGASSKKAE